MAPRQLSTHSLRVDLIIATLCLLVSTTVCSSDCSRSRMLPRVLLLARGDVNTSRRHRGSYTGWRSVSASVTSRRPWCSEHCRARRRTYTLSTTVSSWPTLDGEPWGQLSDGSASYHATTIRLVTDRLLLLVHEFRTTCQPNSATLNRQSKRFANIWKLYCMFSISRGCGAFVTLVLCAVYKCSYLLYLLTRINIWSIIVCQQRLRNGASFQRRACSYSAQRNSLTDSFIEALLEARYNNDLL